MVQLKSIDEPTGALDYVTGTHNSAIAPMADKVIKVKSGRIESITINDEKQSVEGIEL